MTKKKTTKKKTAKKSSEKRRRSLRLNPGWEERHELRIQVLEAELAREKVTAKALDAFSKVCDAYRRVLEPED